MLFLKSEQINLIAAFSLIKERMHAHYKIQKYRNAQVKKCYSCRIIIFK